jgi:hypothetical protein
MYIKMYIYTYGTMRTVETILGMGEGDKGE